MTGRIPTRRIGQSALFSLHRPSPSTYWRPSPSTSSPTCPLSTTPSRALSLNPFKKEPKEPNLENPVLANILSQQNAARRQQTAVERPKLEQGKLAPTSIFEKEMEIPGYSPDLTPEQKKELTDRQEEREKQRKKEKDLALKALRLDPDPLGRKTLERELVIRSLRRRGRLTKDQLLKRTERQMLYKSLKLSTSTKKLTKIMNMIQGKTVEEALVQLRFNKKMVARDVYKGLLVAQDAAIVERGMGLEGLKDRQASTEETGAGRTAAEREAAKLAVIHPDGTRRLPKTGKPTTILLKDGSRKQVYDPSEIYIDQAWVGKDEHLKSSEFRAQGRVNVLRHRTSTFSVLLKEEKTRMRISDELKKKQDNRKLWVALPDRPVTSQRQYCLW